MKAKNRIAHFMGWRLLLPASGIAVLLAFQNCAPFKGQGEVSLASSKAAQAEFFAYPFLSMPTFYSELNLFRVVDPAVAAGNANTTTALENLRVKAAVSFVADPQARVSYEVSVKRPDGYVMCPVETGTLLPGQSAIEFDCVSSVRSTEALVTMKVTANGQTETVEKRY